MKSNIEPSLNQFGQPVGADVTAWKGADSPSCGPMRGRYCRIAALNPSRHSDALYDAYSADRNGILWTYMSVGPFSSKEEFRAWLEVACASKDTLFFAIIDQTTDCPIGMAAYLRIQPSAGVIEVGHIVYSPRLQRTPIATEAMFLLMKRVFDELGYRRYEWKCDSLNTASRQAAERLGFSFDGVFEQSLVYKGRNRDTAWYSILDRDWPYLKNAFLKWLDPTNYDEQGNQRQKLQYFISTSRSLRS